MDLIYGTELCVAVHSPLFALASDASCMSTISLEYVTDIIYIVYIDVSNVAQAERLAPHENQYSA